MLKSSCKIKKLYLLNFQKRTLSSKFDFEWPSNRVRKTFIDYFCANNDHKFIQSSSVLPKKGSGTYFTNAGMNQFKSIILGEVEPGDIIDLNKYIGVANSQKCIRIGGKHNDLEDIGKDTYHHTFFEMLGNWSFGSYQNEKACQLALDLLVNVYKLNINALYFTYFSGNKEFNIPEDLETKNIWLKLGVPESHLLPFDMKCNFWEMDQVGPCGPCTEIHYDRKYENNSSPVKLKQAQELVNAGTERVIELWNLVFMKYNRTGPRSFSPLPLPVVDTGMGLERLTTVLNKLNSNYDTDLFLPLFEHIYSFSTIPHFKNLNKNDPILYSYRTLSDYIRSITISINDGLVPSRNGLGGFLKFLILKSLQLSQSLGIKNQAEFLCQFVTVVVDTLRDAYPDLLGKVNYIQDVIRDTDLKQKIKLENSILITDRYLKKINEPKSLSGEQIWKLFKGDGTGEEISIDFIQNYLKEKNINYDLEKFDKILLADNEKSLKNMKNLRTDYTIFIEQATKLKNLPKTDNSFIYNYTLDNNSNEAKLENLQAEVISIAVKDKNGSYELTDQAQPGQECILILNKTNFYPESGGQQSDRGEIITKSGLIVKVHQVLQIKGFSFHIGKIEEEKNSAFINKNDQVFCKVDKTVRYSTTLNHTGVHLLNHSIRSHFKSENSIMQTSSQVKNDYLKFEFKLNNILKKPEQKDIENIQFICNDLIKKSLPVYSTHNVFIDDWFNLNVKYPVRKLHDVLYPRNLRIVSIGAKWDDFLTSKNTSEDYSAELCCGTHASNTQDLNHFYINSFNAVGDSSFEIEACTSTQALETEKNDKQVLDYLKEMQELHKFKLENDSKMNTNEKHTYLNQIAEKSIQIENIFKSKKTSYLTLHYVKNESQKYRPSKNVLLNNLKSYFQEELVVNSKQASNSVLISSMKPDDGVSFKFMAFDSILHHEQILALFKKIENLHPNLILYNKYRNVYIFYSKNFNEKTQAYFEQAADKILHSNKDTSLIESGKNYKIIKCNLLTKKHFKYFSF